MVRRSESGTSTALDAVLWRSSGPSRGGAALGEAIATLRLWQARRRARQDLAGLNDEMLRDLGLTRADVVREYRKPFWRA